MFLFDGFLTKAASWREKARIYRIFLGLIFMFIVSEFDPEIFI
nr:MAG TPA: hypothetical protein [Caudoviricetes sp.]